MKNQEKEKQEKALRRKRRVRAKIKGTADRPRLCVTRSLKHIQAQVIDDLVGKTLVSAKDTEVKAPAKKDDQQTAGVALAFELGKLIAKKAQDKKINSVVFDKGANKYHGRVKAVAEGAREAGLKL